jgi:hypothetical protein
MLLKLPDQNAPVIRTLTSQGHQTGGETGAGVEPAQTRCEGLTGLAEQMCYATLYGIS